MPRQPAHTTAQPPRTSRTNRDRETLYTPGLMSKIFAVTSLLLVASLVWLVWRDYDRAWKDYQRAFYEKMVEIERTEATQRRRALSSEELEALKGRRDAVADRVGADDELQRLEEEVAALEKDVEAASRRFKEVRGLHTVGRYEFEMARLDWLDLKQRVGEGERRPADLAEAEARMQAEREELAVLATRFRQAKIASENLQVDLEGKRDRIQEIRAPLLEAEAALAEAREVYDAQREKVEGLEQQYIENQFRNAPVIDFLSPTIKIDQKVLPDIHENYNFATSPKVDRCTTCHVGMSMPDFADPELIEEFDIPSYMHAHPALGMIAGENSPHPIDRVGCTVCHHGIGMATDFSRAAHTPSNAEEKQRWKKDRDEGGHGWYKRKYTDYPMIPREYVQGQCFKCHKDGLYYPVHYPERLDHGYVASDPDFKIAAQRRYGEDHPDFTDPVKNRIVEPTEVYGDFALPKAPIPVDGSMEEVIQATRDWLGEHLQASALAYIGDEGDSLEDVQAKRQQYLDEQVHGRGWRAEVFERGYDAVVAYGCQGCHTIEDFGEQVGFEKAPRVGPPLTYIRDKVREDFVAKWIKNPEMFRVDTRMPSFYFFTQKTAEWEHTLTSDGEVVTLPVMDAHLLDHDFRERLGSTVEGADLARFNVELRAIATYLWNQRRPDGQPYTRYALGPDDPGYDPRYDEQLPEGDPENGRVLVNRLGCAACHVLPEYEESPGQFVEDSTERFGHDPLLMRGPRLQGLGSKLPDGRWLNVWLQEPRHYNPVTRMPDMRIEDETGIEGEVTVTAAQQRADIIAYLLSFKNERFDAMEEPEYRDSYKLILDDMYQEFFGKDAQGDLRRPAVVEGEMQDLSTATRLARVGERLMARRGCFGCHEVAGHENDQPIGTELTREGTKNIHQLDFGRVPTDIVPHYRWEFFRTKISFPRVFDWSKELRWGDKLKMPRFNMREDDFEADEADTGAPLPVSTRRAVAGIVQGLVEEPIQLGALDRLSSYEADVVAGRRVIERYGCNNCHTIEGKRGYYWGQKALAGFDQATLPPNLFTQGLRTQSDWLVRFLQEPFWLRPIAEPHMPRFGLSDDEAIALARYFVRLAGRDQKTIIPNPGSEIADVDYETQVEIRAAAAEGEEGAVLGTVSNAVEEAKLLFDTLACNSCHLPRGTPGADPTQGGVAPPFDLANERLRHDWVHVLLHDPAHLISGTKMTAFWSPKYLDRFGREVKEPYQPFRFHLRSDPQWTQLWSSESQDERDEAETRLAEVQIAALTQYVLYHYEPPKADDPGGSEPPR